MTGTANLTCQAEAEPPPSFQWLDAENVPVSSGKIVNEDYKVITKFRKIKCNWVISSFKVSPIKFQFTEK